MSRDGALTDPSPMGVVGQKRERFLPRELRLELEGTLENPFYCQNQDQMIQWRTRYQPLMRAFLVTSNKSYQAPANTEEEEEKEEEIGSRQQPVYATTLTVGLGGLATKVHLGGSGGLTPAVTSSSSTCSSAASLDDYLHDCFFQQRLVTANNNTAPGGMTDDLRKVILGVGQDGGGGGGLKILPYFDEPLQRVSYLIAVVGNFILIDPNPLHVEQYLRDAQRLQKETSSSSGSFCGAKEVEFQIFYTHHPFDMREVAIGEGSPLALSNRESPQTTFSVTTSSSSSSSSSTPTRSLFELKTIDTPGYTATTRSFLLFLDSVPLVAFTGPTIGVDSVARCDVSPCGRQRISPSDRMERSFKCHEGLNNLIGHFNTETLILPSFTGYGHCSYSLDFAWATEWGAMQRVNSNSSMLDAVLGSAWDFAMYVELRESTTPLPVPFNFGANAKGKISAATPTTTTPSRRSTGRPANLLPLSQLLASPRLKAQAIRDTSIPLIVDLRPVADFLCSEAGRIEGTVSIPFSFPIHELGAKRAELWVGALLSSDEQFHYFITSDDELTATTERLFRLGFCSGMFEVIPWSSIPVVHRCKEPWHRMNSHNDMSQLDNKEPPIVGSSSGTAAVKRKKNKKRVVWDCRTTHEYLNGTHVNCIHFNLADTRRAVLEEARRSRFGIHSSTAQGDTTITPDEAQGGGKEAAKFIQGVLVDGRTQGVVTFCAGGYRSHIAVTLVRALWGSSAENTYIGEGVVDDLEGLGEGGTKKDLPGAPTPPPPPPPLVEDLVGGALRLMMQRPDLWITKDRSILCTS